MKTPFRFGVAAGLCCFAVGAFAATQQVNSTIYNVVTKMGQKVDLPNGTKIMGGGESHGTLVDNKTGEVTSSWCVADQYMDKDSKPTVGAGFCTVVYDNGDAVWVSFTDPGANQPSPWTIMGGTGKYAGATGSGTTTLVSQRGDGYAWTTKSVGTLTTK